MGGASSKRLTNNVTASEHGRTFAEETPRRERANSDPGAVMAARWRRRSLIPYSEYPAAHEAPAPLMRTAPRASLCPLRVGDIVIDWKRGPYHYGHASLVVDGHTSLVVDEGVAYRRLIFIQADAGFKQMLMLNRYVYTYETDKKYRGKIVLRFTPNGLSPDAVSTIITNVTRIAKRYVAKMDKFSERCPVRMLAAASQAGCHNTDLTDAHLLERFGTLYNDSPPRLKSCMWCSKFVIHVWQLALFKYAKENLPRPLTFVSEHMPLKASQCAPVHLANILSHCDSWDVSSIPCRSFMLAQAQPDRRNADANRHPQHESKPQPRPGM